MQDELHYKHLFLDFRAELFSFLYRLVAHREQAEDLAQETYLKAFDKLSSFDNRSSFKTWVFAIAVNLARDNQRARQRWAEDWMDLVRDAHVQDPKLRSRKMKIAQSPEVTFHMHEHLNYCFTCTSKTLLLSQQMCLLLKEIYGFKISDIVLITGETEGKVKHFLADSRKAMTRIFKNKCALINKQGVCNQCTGLNKMFNPEQDAHIEANKLKIVKERRNSNYNELLDLRLQMVRELDPLQGEGVTLHDYLLKNSPSWAKHQKNISN